MTALSRRHVIAGAAATVAAAALPAVAVAEAVGDDLDIGEFFEAANAEAHRRRSVAWAQAVRNAWLRYEGPIDHSFRTLFPYEMEILETENCERESPLVAMFEEAAEEVMPQYLSAPVVI
jgi:hypothetical protein